MENMNWPDMVLTPIGRVVSSLELPSLKVGKKSDELEPSRGDVRGEYEKIKELESAIELFDDQGERLHGIEAFSHIVVVYWPHLIKPEDRTLTQVHPMGNREIPKQGIFATCSPVRPNPVLISVIRLLSRDGNTLNVKGFEAVNNSPVVDIKPCSPHYIHADNLVIPDWMPGG